MNEKYYALGLHFMFKNFAQFFLHYNKLMNALTPHPSSKLIIGCANYSKQGVSILRMKPAIYRRLAKQKACVFMQIYSPP